MIPNHLILFDGDCNLCNTSVQFVLKHDPNGLFQFASLQSSTGQAILKQNGLAHETYDTVILVENGRLLTHSTAVLTIARQLRFPLSLCYPLIVIPRPVRDLIYRFVATHRYRWFGKTEAVCWLPTPELNKRFIR